jgi:hypothetical protein
MQVMGLQNGRISGFQVFTSSRSPRLTQDGAWSNAPDERQVFGKPDLQCPIFDDGRVLILAVVIDFRRLLQTYGNQSRLQVI